MKTKALFFVAIFVTLSLAGFATVFTVSDLPQDGAQYETLQASDDASDVSPFTLVAENRNGI